MVEFVSEKIVTGEYNEDVGCYSTAMTGQGVIELVVGKTYIVVINSKSYKTVCELIDDGYIGEAPTIGDKNPLDGLSVNMPFQIVRSETNTDDPITILAWKADLGETITLAIYEEQEVVKKLDPKFVDGGGVTFCYVTDVSEDVYIYTDEDCTNKLTNAELEEITKSSFLVLKNVGAKAVGIMPLQIPREIICSEELGGQVAITVFTGDENNPFANFYYHTAEYAKPE